jgi:hypothetical protein
VIQFLDMPDIKIFYRVRHARFVNHAAAREDFLRLFLRLMEGDIAD